MTFPINLRLNKLLIFLSLSIACFNSLSQSIEFVPKEFVIKDSDPTEKISINIPKECNSWESNIVNNLSQFSNFSKDDDLLKAFFESYKLIDDFSFKLANITTAQCLINQNSLVIDVSFSDQVFFNEIVRSYIVYQQISDLDLDKLDLEDKEAVKDQFDNIYKSIYEFKKDELLSVINDLELEVDVGMPGVNVSILRNDLLLGVAISDINGIANYTVTKDHLIPAPGEKIKIRIRIQPVGFKSAEFQYELSDIRRMDLEDDLLRLKYDLDKDEIDIKDIKRKLEKEIRKKQIDDF